MSVVSSSELAAELGSRLGGIVISQVVPSPWKTLAPLAHDYQRLRHKRGSASPSYGSLEGFIAARVFVEGLERAGRSLTRERLVSAFETFDDVDVGGFRVKYGNARTAGSSFVELSMLSRNGEFVR